MLLVRRGYEKNKITKNIYIKKLCQQSYGHKMHARNTKTIIINFIFVFKINLRMTKIKKILFSKKSFSIIIFEKFHFVDYDIIERENSDKYAWIKR